MVVALHSDRIADSPLHACLRTYRDSIVVRHGPIAVKRRYAGRWSGAIGAKSQSKRGVNHNIGGSYHLSLLLSLRRRIRTTWYIELCVAAGGNTTRFQALIDTGNRLREPISGLPVLIAEEHLLSKILPETGYRAVAFGALGGGGMLKCFHPDGIWAVTRHGLSATPDVWIAVSPGRLPGTTQALAPGEFLTLSSH